MEAQVDAAPCGRRLAFNAGQDVVEVKSGSIGELLDFYNLYVLTTASQARNLLLGDSGPSFEFRLR
nr:hypothetical protein [Arthrobacter sp. HY1533]